MKQINLILIVVITFCITTIAQENTCPKINLTVPDSFLYPEHPVTFTAKVEGEKQTNKLEYFWIFSGGKIIKGQGESTVEFEPNEEDNNGQLAVAVKVTGLPSNCPDTVSQFVIVAGLPIGEPVEELGKVSFNRYKLSLDNFLIAVVNNPDYEGLIVLDFNKSDSRNYKISLLKNIIKFLDFRKFDKKQITFAISESDYEQTVFWIVPQGAKFPKSSTKGYKRVSEENYQIVKAEELIQKINDLCLKNASF